MRKSIALCGVLTLAIFTGVQDAKAASLTILNAGFETANLSILGQPNGPFNQLLAGSTIFAASGTLANWTVASSSLDAAAGGFAPNTSGLNWTSQWWGGTNIGYLQAGTAGVTISLSQTLSDVLLNDSTYTFSALIGNRTFGNLEDYHLDLFAGSTLLATTGNNVAAANNTSGMDSLIFNSGSNNPLAGQALTVRLRSVGLGGSTFAVPTEAFFDNVGLAVVPNSSTAPEPTTLSLIAVGLGLIGFARHRKQGYSS
ncbi:MAG: PEP-CTERM sorting domain-containing protein [Acidobacteriota bacterium]